MTAETRSLHRKLAQVMYEAERIPKNGTAPREMGGFPFVQVGDAADYIRKALAEKVITMMPTKVTILGQTEHATKSGGSMTITDIMTEWTLTDGESGESITIMSYGAGGDGGDKYSGKAQTNAMKYALLMGFLLSTGDDPELGAEERGRRSAPAPAIEQPTPEDEEAPAATGKGESLELLGRLKKAGVVRKGTATNYKLEAREQPDGHTFGFRLELDDAKDIPQVYADGPLGSAIVMLTGGDLESLIGQKVTCRGLLYSVHAPGRKSYYRMHLQEFTTAEWAVPAAEPPADAPTVPLFDPDEEATIAAAVDKAGSAA